MGKSKGSIHDLRRGRTLAQLEAVLKDPAVTAAFPAATVHAERKRLERERRRLFGTGRPQSGTSPENSGEMCSHAWASAVWNEGVQYPPGGEGTRMVRCRRCRIPTPPECVGPDRRCDDCRHDAAEAAAARAKAKEREAERAAEAVTAAEASERDAQGRAIVDTEPPANAFARALEEMRIRGIMLQESKLPTEDADVLAAQIELFLAGKPTSLMVDFGRGEGPQA